MTAQSTLLWPQCYLFTVNQSNSTNGFMLLSQRFAVFFSIISSENSEEPAGAIFSSCNSVKVNHEMCLCSHRLGGRRRGEIGDGVNTLGCWRRRTTKKREKWLLWSGNSLYRGNRNASLPTSVMFPIWAACLHSVRSVFIKELNKTVCLKKNEPASC